MTGSARIRRRNAPARPGRGFVIVLPGGGYRIRAEHEAGPLLDWLASIGWNAGVVEYTVDPARYPRPLDEVLTALAEVRTSVEGPIGVLGFSAGGHLAGLAATATREELDALALRTGIRGTRPDFAVLGYPVVSMVDHPHIGSRDSLLDGSADDQLASRLSIENRVDDATGPMFVWTTANDDLPARHSLLLADRLIAHGIPLELHIYPDGPHGLGLATETPVVREWTAAAADWLGRIRG